MQGGIKPQLLTFGSQERAQLEFETFGGKGIRTWDYAQSNPTRTGLAPPPLGHFTGGEQAQAPPLFCKTRPIQAKARAVHSGKTLVRAEKDLIAFPFSSLQFSPEIKQERAPSPHPGL